MNDWNDDSEDELGGTVGRPAWLDHLSPEWQAWREKQILKGRDPDPYIKQKLIEAGVLAANGDQDC